VEIPAIELRLGIYHSMKATAIDATFLLFADRNLWLNIEQK